MKDDKSHSLFLVDFQPTGKRIRVDPGTNILEAAQEAGVEIVSPCSGKGTCKSCRILLIEGNLSSISPVEEKYFGEDDLLAGFRLACQAAILSDLKIFIPPESLSTPQRLLLESQAIQLTQVGKTPIIQCFDIELESPTLDDSLSDVSRIVQKIQSKYQVKICFAQCNVLRKVSKILREQNWKLRVLTRKHEVIALLPVEAKYYGLAVDIGTTKIAAYLMDLQNGDILVQQGIMNPQISYGEDVVSRIAYSNEHKNGGEILQQCLIERINQMLCEMLSKAGNLDYEQIVDAVVVGNTVIEHLFAHFPVYPLGTMPYVPMISDAIDFPASSIGLHLASGAYVYLPPIVAGYVGADHVAMVLASGVYLEIEPVIAVDIGTNTEITLVNNGQMYCCSCASGPAFEGAHIQHGMRAAAGAIERVQIHGDTIHIQTIERKTPVGICGSGILDAVAEMNREGIIDRSGRFEKDAINVRGNAQKREFVLVPAQRTGNGHDITINRKDINEIQLAKAAIRAGIEVLLRVAGIESAQIERFFVAGAFGTYLNLKSAVFVGMFPELPIERFLQIGNAAGAGARQMLFSDDSRRISQEISSKITYIELTTHPQFQQLFINAMYFNSNPK